jgi:hypothetical protein
MLISIDKISDYKLIGTDGEVGDIKEFFFDDDFWTVRYLVVTTGSWLNKRDVLISPYFISEINHGLEEIHVDLTQDQIRNSPDVDTERPVSREYEKDYYTYYGAPIYWIGPYSWGASPVITHNRADWKKEQEGDSSWNPNLRSSKDVSGHKIQASDDTIGDVDDFIIDDENWTIRYFVVDTGKWLSERQVLISPQWIDRISWDDKKVFVTVSSDDIKNSPEYDETTLGREYESSLYDYYGLEGYWDKEAVYGDYSHWINR